MQALAGVVMLMAACFDGSNLARGIDSELQASSNHRKSLFRVHDHLDL